MANDIAEVEKFNDLLNNPKIKQRFDEMLKAKSAGFLSSLLSLVNTRSELKVVAKSNPRSILTAAAMAASIDLPINQNLGYAYIVPYANEAQFQMGYKGYIQLAIRTREYKTINASKIYSGQKFSVDPLSGDVEIYGEKKTGVVIAYVAYFQMCNGYEKSILMTKEEVTAHAKRYSKAFNVKDAPWQVNFDAMALKTVIKLLLSKWGMLSIEMQKAVTADDAVIESDDLNQFKYVDNPEHAEEKPLMKMPQPKLNPDEPGDAIEPA